METLPNEIIGYIFDYIHDFDNLLRTSHRFKDIINSQRKYHLCAHATKFTPTIAEINSINHEITSPSESTLHIGEHVIKYRFTYRSTGNEIQPSNDTFCNHIKTSKK